MAARRRKRCASCGNMGGCECGDRSSGDIKKKHMSTRAFLKRRARGMRTRVGSRFRDPQNGQFV